MTTRVFLSHSNTDLPLAKVVASSINKMFRGDVIVYLAEDQVVGGVAWKEDLRKNLENCDAIISILSPDSLGKHWIYIEWSPFWIAGKPFFVLATEGVQARDLINPMQERQVTFLHKRESIQKFLSQLSSLSGSSSISVYEMLDDLIIDIDKATKQKFDNRYGIYRRHEKELPPTDAERANVARYFYERSEMEDFIRVTKRINNDEIVLDFIYLMFRDTKIEHQKELQLSYELARNMNRASNISSIVLELIELGNIDADETARIVDIVSDRSQDEVSVIARKLIDKNFTHSKLFEYIITKKLKSNANLRALAVYFLRLDKEDDPQFEFVVKKIINNAELKNLCIEIVDQHKHRKAQFEVIVERMISLGGTHLPVVFKHLSKIDLSHAKEYSALLLARYSDDESVEKLSLWKSSK